MRIFVRHALVPATLPASEPALILEGDWPPQERTSRRWSLDRAIDARHGWIDTFASDLAQQVAEEPAYRLPCAADVPEASLAWINALSLRYYLVKLLRVVAFFESAGCQPIEPRSLRFESGRDEEYRRLITCLAQQRGWTLRADETPGTSARHAMSTTRPANSRLRRLAGHANRLGDLVLDAMLHRRHAETSKRSGPILLCGNPRVLDPVCRELHRRGMPVCWLYDRFAFGSWLAWRRRGVRQAVCNSSTAPALTLADRLARPCVTRGVDLAPAIEVWMNRTARQRAAAQQHLWRQVAAHVARLKPAAIVLDEDATPLKRIAVAVARQQGATSLVVQHGAPRVRFGFAPLAADRFLAWGETTRQQLRGWGVPADRVNAAGSPQDWPRISARRRNRRILLFATVPPSDARPDAVAYHLTRQTHDDLLHLACAAVARLPGYVLVVKLHPRAANLDPFRQIARAYEGLRYRLIRRGSFAKLLAKSACVLNCGSSAGIEAASYGWPVIELLPAGSIELTPASQWGLLGAASSAEQLDTLLNRALCEANFASCQPCTGDVFAATGMRGAEHIADAILSQAAAADTHGVEHIRRGVIAEAAA